MGGFGLTRCETKELVGEYIRALGRENPFTDNLPGYDWLASFLKRHPELTSRVPEQLKMSRAKSTVNKRIFDEWFQLLKTTLEENNLIDMPEKIYNVEESYFPLHPKRIKVLCKRGISHLFRLIGGSDRDSITVQGCARSDGFMLLPYILYVAKSLRVNWTTNGPAGAKYIVSEKGWMDKTSFYDWFYQIFHPIVTRWQTSCANNGWSCITSENCYH